MKRTLSSITVLARSFQFKFFNLRFLTTNAAAIGFLAVFVVPSAPAQYIYVANAGDDTISKIDINTNQEVARYATWFTSGANHIAHSGNHGAGPAPSRVLEDSAGYLFGLNRFFSPSHLPVLIKIKPTGGTPGINTSNGPTVLPMIDQLANNQIDPGDATDVRILWGKEIGVAPADNAGLGRALCMDRSGVLWVGMYVTQRYYKVDPTTGLMLPPLAGIPTPGHKPYGCVVSATGKLWSVDGSNTLAEIDTATNQVTIRNHSAFGVNYSLSIFNGCGSGSDLVYMSDWSVAAKTYFTYNPQTSSFNVSPVTIPQFSSLSVGVDLNGNIVSGQRSSTGRVIKTTPTGTVLWDTNAVGSTVAATDLHGIIIDQHNDVWAVHLYENRVVKYNGSTGQLIAQVPVGNRPYTYSNPPPPGCPCAEARDLTIKCEERTNNLATYSWSFTFTNHSPFLTPATAIDISSSQVVNLTPTHFQFTNPVPVNGQATVSGTFSVANPVAGSHVCLDIKLNANEGWCCPTERVCFVLPDCPLCGKLEAKFICQNAKHILQLSVTNQGPTTAQGAQIFSNTSGVTISPQVTMQNFPPNTPVTVPLTISGASPGQSISLSVVLGGPIDPKTGVSDWCCTTTATITYPKTLCALVLDGWVFNDLNRNGLRDSLDEGLAGRVVTLTDSKGASRTTTTDTLGRYRFDEVEQGTYKLAAQPVRGWATTAPESGVHTVIVAGPGEKTFEFGFAKTEQ